jgi:hypothetical protein
MPLFAMPTFVMRVQNLSVETIALSQVQLPKFGQSAGDAL